MESFRDLDDRFSLLPVDVVRQLERIAEGRGKEAAARLRHPRQLEALRVAAAVQSIETSNALEGITAPRTRINALAADRTTPRNRPEREIAGYRHVLGQIHDQGLDIPFDPDHVQQLHGYLFRYTTVRHAGRFKTIDNAVTERQPDGATTVRFVPVAATRTPAAMEELHRRFNRAVEAATVPYPILCAAYVLDFLTIHPFTDGNGRMARLITLWLLYRGGYSVGQYVSVERLIADSKDDYYASLAASTEAWHENGHDVLPWTRYLLQIIEEAYAAFETHLEGLALPAADRQAAIRRVIAAWPSDEFAAAELHAALPGVSRTAVNAALRTLSGDGALVRIGAGRGSRWQRAGRRPGAEEVLADGTGIRVEPIAGERLVERDGRLVIPTSGGVLDEDTVQALRDADQR